jgi:DNA ligase 1
MSDIRSFFGGKKAAPRPASGDANDASKPVSEKESNVAASTATKPAEVVPTVKNTEKVVASDLYIPSSSSISTSVCDIHALPADVQKIISWKAGEPVPYMAVCETFEEISKVSGRLEKESLFTRLFRAVIATTPKDLDVIVYLASNEVSPVYEGMELGIGDSLLVKAVCEATGRNKDAVEEAYEKEGDLVRSLNHV